MIIIIIIFYGIIMIVLHVDGIQFYIFFEIRNLINLLKFDRFLFSLDKNRIYLFDKLPLFYRSIWNNIFLSENYFFLRIIHILSASSSKR